MLHASSQNFDEHVTISSAALRRAAAWEQPLHRSLGASYGPLSGYGHGADRIDEPCAAAVPQRARAARAEMEKAAYLPA